MTLAFNKKYNFFLKLANWNHLKWLNRQIHFSYFPIFFFIFLSSTEFIYSQNLGGTAVGFGINASVYANQTAGTPAPVGSSDWFKLGSDPSGRNIIKQDAATVTSIKNLLISPGYNGAYEVRMNKGVISIADGSIPSSNYKLLIDGVWARDYFGGTGGIDSTAFVVSSKNTQDPAAWSPGAGNVLGKNDLIDVAAHMFREFYGSGSLDSRLWFTGLINRAEPGGSAYMDFEFFVNRVAYNKTAKLFNTGGPDMGHTSFLFDATGKVTRIGDVLFNVSLGGGGTVPGLEVRIWMKRADYNVFKLSPPVNLPFTVKANVDGATTTSTYVYAGIAAKVSGGDFGYVNAATQLPPVPPFGSKNTKSHIYLDSATGKYAEYSLNELALNMTAFGLDEYQIAGYSRCIIPWRSYMIKTRSSEAFSAALKDFAGPYDWGQAAVDATSANAYLSCSNQTVTLTPSPLRDDVTYLWSTLNGHIVSGGNSASAIVDKAGTYYVTMTLPTGCSVTSPPFNVTQNAAEPPITAISSTVNPNCNNQNNGSIGITVTGGTPALSYSWTGPSSYTNSIEDITGLASGTYTVTVTDSKGCSYTSSGINVTSATSGVSGTETNILCYSGTTGSINITATGTAPYTYSWSNGKKIEDLTNISSGTYTVTATDALGCTSSASFGITQPAAVLSGSVVKVNDSNTDPAIGNGTANLTVSGGTTTYSFAWTGPSGFTSTSEDLSSLKYGSYSVLVTDANGCKTTASVFIYEPEICNDGIENDGDGLTDCNDPDCAAAAVSLTPSDANPCINEIITYTAGGTAAQTYQWVVVPTTADATFSTSVTSQTFTVTWHNIAPAKVCVRAQNNGCLSEQTCITVNPKQKPPQPITIEKN